VRIFNLFKLINFIPLIDLFYTNIYKIVGLLWKKEDG